MRVLVGSVLCAQCPLAVSNERFIKSGKAKKRQNFCSEEYREQLSSW